jgi:hypothetical protein
MLMKIPCTHLSLPPSDDLNISAPGDREEIDNAFSQASRFVPGRFRISARPGRRLQWGSRRLRRGQADRH